MVNRPTAEPREIRIVATLWAMLNFPNEMYGMRPKAKRKPKRKPKKCAQLSNQGRRPSRKKKKMGTSSLRKARHGRAYMLRFCITSTNRQATMPNCDPVGPA